MGRLAEIEDGRAESLIDQGGYVAEFESSRRIDSVNCANYTRCGPGYPAAQFESDLVNRDMNGDLGEGALCYIYDKNRRIYYSIW